MKAIKKVFALLLTAAMVLGMATTALAASDGSITVKNADSTATYTAYKIFDVTYSGTNYSYSISKDSAWLSTVQAYIAQEGEEGITLTLSADGNNYVVTTTDTFSAADFAQYLNAALYGYTAVTEGTEFDSNTTYYVKNGSAYSKCTGLNAFEDGVTYYTKTSKDLLSTVASTGTTLNNDENGTATATGLAYGYYFVTSSLGSLANLTTTNPSVTIYDKNEVTPFDKEANDVDVEIGQTVTYTITGEVPSTTGYETYTYKVSDTLSEGLTFNKDVKVTFGTTSINPTATELVYNTTNDGFVLTFDMTKYQEYVGQTITITYSAVVNENAVVTTAGNPNNATLVYSNDPNDSTSTDTETDIVKVYTVDLTIDKYATNADNQNDTSKKLSGAEFVLVKKDTTANTETFYQATYVYTYTSGDDTVTVYSKNGTDYYTDIACTDANKATIPDETTPTKGAVADVSWVSSINDATVVTTDTNGAATFDGLEVGTYYLREIKAPDGYNLLTSDEEVTITRGTDDSNNVTLSGTSAAVANSAGTELPSTGGIGTTIFYVIGSVLVIGAAVLLITKKRMSGTQE